MRVSLNSYNVYNNTTRLAGNNSQSSQKKQGQDYNNISFGKKSSTFLNDVLPIILLVLSVLCIIPATSFDNLRSAKKEPAKSIKPSAIQEFIPLKELWEKLIETSKNLKVKKLP